MANYLAKAHYILEVRGDHAQILPRLVLVAASGLVLNSGIVEIGSVC